MTDQSWIDDTNRRLWILEHTAQAAAAETRTDRELLANLDSRVDAHQHAITNIDKELEAKDKIIAAQAQRIDKFQDAAYARMDRIERALLRICQSDEPLHDAVCKILAGEVQS